MRRLRYWPQMALVLALTVTNGGCVLIPELEDRIVELAVGGTTVLSFESTGTSGEMSDSNTGIDILAGINLRNILDDAGIDAADVKSIKLSGVDYRITKEQADRQITDGNVTFGRGATGDLALVTGFTGSAATKTGWLPAPLDPAGLAVAEINRMLDDILRDIRNNTTLAVTTIDYAVTGASTPTNVATEFSWDIKLKFTIVGRVEVTVPS